VKAWKAYNDEPRRRQGCKERAMLADIYRLFTEGFDSADLKEAKALLDQLSE
jgi:hypothetical protein